MGCLNSKGQFNHWFGNIHLSGPCNRSCYFCIGQHMMELDSYNTLNSFPLPSIDQFVQECLNKGITEINMTGSNTDPMLYKHTEKLRRYLEKKIPGLIFGIRTNAVKRNYSLFQFYDKGSITICSFDPAIYKAMMGQGKPPNIEEIMTRTSHWRSRKINVVLGPENLGRDLFNTLNVLAQNKIEKVNLREPYGQPHVGNPLIGEFDRLQVEDTLGNPNYAWGEALVTYWDVHYTEVESVNLYANGVVSSTYPITKGHSKKGTVKDQSNFNHGRHREQWVSL